MNTNTLEKLRKLKFHGMYHAFKNCLESGRYDQYTADELLAQLIDAEWDDRHNRRIARQIFYAKFRYKAAVEDVNYEASRNIDRNLMNRPADCTFVQRNENLLITARALARAISLPRWDIRPVSRDIGYYMQVPQNSLPNLKWPKPMELISRRSQNLNGSSFLY